MVEFVQGLFDGVPAPTLVEAVPDAICRTITFGDQAEIPYAGLEVCDLGDACPDLSFPVWFDPNGQLGFGPDSPERLVAMFCPDAISDPQRRQQLTESAFQGG
jgi:hypothetical protein